MLETVRVQVVLGVAVELVVICWLPDIDSDGVKVNDGERVTVGLWLRLELTVALGVTP